MITKNIYYFDGIYYNLINNTKGGKTMTRFMNMQFSVFGNFTEIKATQENVFKLMNEFKGNNLLPSTVTNQNIDVNTGIVETESRISFISENKNFNFIINNNRIDFNYELFSLDQTNIDSFINETFTYFSEMYMNIYKGFKFKGNRLALNVNVLGDKKINDRLNHYYEKNINSFKFYSNKIVNDFNYSISGKSEINIGEKKEIINVITELKTAVNNNNNEQRLMTHFDLNTLHENFNLRFENKDINGFLESIKPVLNELILNFKDCDDNDI